MKERSSSGTGFPSVVIHLNSSDLDPGPKV